MLASGISGFDVAGTIGGLIATIVAIVTLTLSVIASNARKRRDYENDMAAAREHLRPELEQERLERRQAEADRDRYRDIAYGIGSNAERRTDVGALDLRRDARPHRDDSEEQP